MPQTLRPLQPTDLFADSWDFLNDSDESLQTQFSGPSSPASPKAYQLWADTAAGQLKMRNGNNDGWLIVGLLGSIYLGLLPLSGGLLSGDLDMGGKKVLNLALGTGTAAARQQELDLKAPIAAPAFTGDAQVNQDPATVNSIVRRSWADGRFLALQGGSMLGSLVLQNDAAAALEAVTLQQLKAFVQFNVGSGHRHDGVDARKVRGTDIDSGAAADGLPLRANGGGVSSFAKIPAVSLNVAYGNVAGNGTVIAAGSGNWTVVRISIGTYDITINSGILPAAPSCLATPNDSAALYRICTCIINSATSVRVKVTTSLAVVEDGPFSFLAL